MEQKRASKRRTSGILTAVFAAAVVAGYFVAIAPGAGARGPCGEFAYANEKTFCVHISKVLTHPHANLIAQAEPLYIAAYFPLPAGCNVSSPSTCGAEKLPSGYQPLCDPCFHGGALNNFPYHDHVLSGAPGFGHNGTAGVMKGPWLLFIVVYNSTYSSQTGFTPFTSLAEIQAGETAGDFAVINPGAQNPYEINTGVVIIFGVQPAAT